MTKQCKQCKNSLDISAFEELDFTTEPITHKGHDICNGCRWQKEAKQTNESWEKEFIKRFANPTAKFLGNDFADYPKANVKDAICFIRNLLSQQRQEIIEMIENKMEKQKIDVLVENKKWNEKGRRIGNYNLGYDDAYFDLSDILKELGK